MITAIHREKLIPFLALLFALAGMTFSVIGEASSHGVAELSGFVSADQDDHSLKWTPKFGQVPKL